MLILLVYLLFIYIMNKDSLFTDASEIRLFSEKFADLNINYKEDSSMSSL